jgi:uncharacterized membrane protein YgdD (TMEM256/DUF423 family)
MLLEENQTLADDSATGHQDGGFSTFNQRITPMSRIFLIAGSLLGLMAMAAGTISAHALRERLSIEEWMIFEAGVRYQMYHALALFAVAWLCERIEGKLPIIAGWLFVAGIVLFSFSLYFRAVSGNPHVGRLAPIGGLSLMIGWILLLVSGLSLKSHPGSTPKS